MGVVPQPPPKKRSYDAASQSNRIEEIDPIPQSRDWTCIYCGTLNQKDRCIECGAPSIWKIK